MKKGRTIRGDPNKDVYLDREEHLSRGHADRQSTVKRTVSLSDSPGGS